jgi:hypothetical protein
VQDRPTATELLDALAEFLYAEVRGWVPRERRFQVLVAANLCAVIGRELEAGEGPSIQDLALFRSLLGERGSQPPAGEAEGAARDAAGELARRIRAGDLDDRLPEVAASLRDHVRRKLEIARPGYAED